MSCYYAEVGSHLNASRVLPHPPDPISVNTRFESKSARTFWRSRSRPTNEVTCSGKFWRKLLSDLVRGALPNDSSLVDLGQHRLRDVAGMEQVFQLAHPELRSDFPPLTTSSQSRECESGTSPPLHH